MSPSELQHLMSEKSKDTYVSAGPRTDKTRKIFEKFSGRKKILDVGCANGEILAPFAKRHELHGVDISEGVLAHAAAAGFQTTVLDLEANPLPYADKTFDVVFSGETIEHQVDTDWMLSEFNRVLKPGGTLILTYPNIRTVLSLGMMLFFDMPPMYAARYRSAHYRDFTLRTIRLAVTNNGFDFQNAIGCAFFLPRLGEFGSWLATYFPSWTNTTIIEAVKVSDATYSADRAISLDIYDAA